jgi:hypothetical protein
MPRSIAVCGAMLFGAVLMVVTGAATARAQMSSDPTEIATCLCMQQGVATLSSDMSAKTQSLAAVRQHLADLDARLAQARPNVDVNNSDSVGRYKALLQQRDAAYQQSLGPVVTDAEQATARYNSHVAQYNAQCANHQFNADVMAQIQAHLSCPPLQ